MAVAREGTDKLDLRQGHARARNVHDLFEKKDQLGHGTYGEVFLAVNKETGERVALKKIKLEASKEKRQGFPITALREMRVLKQLSHENVVQLKEVCRSNIFQSNGYKGSIYLIFEYVEHDLWGLHERIQKQSPAGVHTTMPSAMAKSLAQQMLRGLAHCHSRKVLHRDLKASNLLISRNGVLKLADFGLSRPYVSHTGRVGELTYRVCTLWYRPPELLLGSQSYGPEVDIWSAGCILYEMLAGGPLFGGNKELTMLTRIQDMLGPIDWPASPNIQGAKALKHMVVPSIRMCEWWFDECPRHANLANVPSMGKGRIHKQTIYCHVCSYEAKVPATTSVFTLDKQCQELHIPQDAFRLLAAMLSLDPAKRPTAEQCLSFPYFQNEPQPMSSKDFLTQTAHFDQSHEYVVKGKAAAGTKRQRPADAPGSEHEQQAARGPVPGMQTRHAQPMQPVPPPAPSYAPSGFGAPPHYPPPHMQGPHVQALRGPHAYPPWHQHHGPHPNGPAPPSAVAASYQAPPGYQPR